MSLMMLDMGEPVLFAHIPKTGGRSIRTGRRISSRLIAADPFCEKYQQWYAPWEPFYRDMPSFGFVRDPYDRAESCWRDFRHTRGLTNLDFEEFLLAHGPGRASESQVADPRTAAHHLALQTHSFHGLSQVDFIGRFWNLQADLFEFIDSTPGLKPFDLPVLHPSKGPRVERTNRLKTLVSDLYYIDYRRLDDMGVI